MALDDAVQRISWSGDAGVYKVIFLVGDAPPHMDYQDDVKYPQTLAAARSRGIVVNTIQAGEDGAASAVWHKIAQAGQGQYAQVGMSGQAVAIATLIVLAFALFGQPVLTQLGVSLPALQVAGGIILLIIALDMTLSRRTPARLIAGDEIILDRIDMEVA